ncbi:MAG: hypothetical protein ACJ739_16075 [Acidimicrobiales bacterium]
MLAVLALPTLAHAAPAGDGPYGSTTTTADHGPQPSCRLRETTVAAGGTATARLKAVPRNSQVEIRFDGEVVAEDTATGPGSSPRVNTDIDFVVPADAEPGDHDVTAVGAEFTAPCGTLTTPDGEVLGETITNDGNGSGSLPKTGVYVALLLVIGVALVIVGRAVVEASRQRARAAQAHHRRVSTHR